MTRHAAHYSAMGWDNTYQEALHPCLSAIVHRTVQVAGQPIDISPHVGRLSIQVKQSEVKAARRIIPGASHICTWKLRRQTESLIHALRTDVSNLGLHRLCNLTQVVKKSNHS
jgi:hypothetical protein